MDHFKRTLIICWFGVFVMGMGLSQIAPILPLFVRELGYSDPADLAFYTGFAFSVTPLCMSVFSPIWAFLGAKYGYKNMLLRASLGISAATLWLSFANSATELIIIRALTGIFSGFGAAVTVYIAVISPKNQVAYALGVISTASTSGSLLGPMLGGTVAELFGVRAVFDLIAFLTFCSFLMIYFFIREQRVQKEPRRSGEGLGDKKGLIIMLFITTFIIQFGTFGSMPILSLFVGEIHAGGNVAFWAGLVVAASGISNLFCAPRLGRLADKIGPSKVILAALIFCGTCFYLQSLASNVYWLIAVRLLIGVGLGGLLPCINAMLKKSVSAKNLSLIFGFNQTCQFLGSFTGAFAGGLIASQLSVSAVFAFICACFLTVGLLFFIFEREYILGAGGL